MPVISEQVKTENSHISVGFRAPIPSQVPVYCLEKTLLNIETLVFNVAYGLRDFKSSMEISGMGLKSGATLSSKHMLMSRLRQGDCLRECVVHDSVCRNE